jgi:hypothetical protein
MNKSGQIFKSTQNSQYYPMYLANGIDTTLVGWNGGPLLNYKKLPPSVALTDVYWYKAERFTKDNLALAMPNSSAVIVIGSNEYRPKEFEQWFEPDNAILYTIVKCLDNICYKVTSFLHQDNILVEHFEFTNFPDGERIYVDLNVWLAPHIHLKNKPEKYVHNVDEISGVVSIDFSEESITGRASVFGSSDKFEVVNNGRHLRFETTGKSFTKYTCVMDNFDSPSYRQEIAEKVKTATGSTEYYNKLKNEHCQFWQTYHKASVIITPDSKLNYSYMLANYLLKGNLHRKTGLWSVGGVPSHWNYSGPLWDSLFPHTAFLKANHHKEAESSVLNLTTYLPEWHREAARLNSKGAYTYSAEAYRNNVDILFINGVYAAEMWNQYAYSGKSDVLEKLYESIKALVDFLIDDAIVEKEDYAFVRKCYPVEEIKFGRWDNDAWTAGTVIAALRALKNSVMVLGKEIDCSYEIILNKLEKGFNKNYSDGVLKCGYEQTETKAGAFAFLIVPDFDSTATVNEMLSSRNAYDGLMPDIHRQEETVKYPWIDFNVATLMAANGHPATYERIKSGLTCVNSLGGLCESLNIDGSLWQQWFLTAQGAFISALVDMLAVSVDHELRLLFGVPGNWNDFSFSGLVTSLGLSVDADIKNGKIMHLRIKNNRSDSVNVKLILPERFKGKLSNGISLNIVPQKSYIII